MNIAILVPVLGRAHQIQLVLDSIAGATTLDHRVILICSPGDPALKAAKKTKATVLVTTWAPDRSDYAKKLGLGFHSTDEPWLFQGATDLIFYPGWDTAADQVRRKSGANVIGTNDLGNPLVKRGRHSTHSFFSREYIDKWTGTADRSGVVFSELYDHQWTDNEFVETAILRRQWAFARRSVVEHMHPHWNKADMDETYEKATRATTEDQRLFMQRRALVTRLVQKEKRQLHARQPR